MREAKEIQVENKSSISHVKMVEDKHVFKKRSIIEKFLVVNRY